MLFSCLVRHCEQGTSLARQSTKNSILLLKIQVNFTQSSKFCHTDRSEVSKNSLYCHTEALAEVSINLKYKLHLKVWIFRLFAKGSKWQNPCHFDLSCLTEHSFCHTERSEVSINLKRVLNSLDFSLCANALRSKWQIRRHCTLCKFKACFCPSLPNKA